MAGTKPCKSCGKEVSTNADICPNCGGQVTAPWVLILFFGMIAIVFLAMMAGGG